MLKSAHAESYTTILINKIDDMGIQRLTPEEFNSSRPGHRTGTLIKEVDSVYKPGLNEKKYYFDKNSKEVFETKPLALLKRSWSYYTIDFEEIVEAKDLKKTLTELDNSCSLDILINYSIKLQQNPQTELIKFLITELDTEKAINDRILRWISGFATNEPEFVKRFFSLHSQLIQHLVDEARKLGLYLDIAINTNETIEPSNTTINGVVDIKVNNYFNKIPLSFELELSVLDDKKIEGMQALTSSQQLNGKIKEIIKKTINDRNTIDLHYFHYNIQVAIRELLLRELDIELDRLGLKPEFLKLESKLVDLPPERSKLKHSVNCITKNGYDIDIKHSLILTLKNLGDYYNSGIIDIDNWVKSELDRITQDYIFEKDYTELALQFESDSIKAEIAKSVAHKGYEIKQLITVSNVDVPEYFDIELGKDEEFPTQKEDVKIRLNILANGKIRNPQKIARYINPKTTQDGIIQKMKETVKNTVRQFIHRVDPKIFYMYFNIPQNGHTTSLADDLKDRILNKMEQEFGVEANDVDIILKQLETDLIRKFKALLGVDHTVHIQIYSLQAKFDAQFMVTNVHGDNYDLFKAKCDTYKNKDILSMLEDISNLIKHDIELHLKRIESLNEEFLNSDEFLKYMMQLLDNSRKLVIERFGLEIRIARTLRPYPTISEELKLKKRIVHKNKTTKQIEGLAKLVEDELDKVIENQLTDVDIRYDETKREELINKTEKEINDSLSMGSAEESYIKKPVLPNNIDLDYSERKKLESKTNDNPDKKS